MITNLKNRPIEESTFLYILMACISMSILLVIEIVVLSYPLVDMITWIVNIILSSLALYLYSNNIRKDIIIKVYFSIVVIVVYPFAWFFSDVHSPTPLIYGIIMLVSVIYLLKGFFRVILIIWLVILSTVLRLLGLYYPDFFPTVTIEQFIKDTWIQIPLTFSAISILLINFSNNLRQKNQSLEVALSQDYLTGVYNRRYIYNYLAELQQRSKQDKNILIGLIDINEFKAINDTYGHVIGDHVLMSVARHIEYLFKDKGVISRTGGDEFVVVMPLNDKFSCNGFIEKFRNTSVKVEVNNDLIYTKNKPPKPYVTISGGFIKCNVTAPIDYMIAQADKNMYRAKLESDNAIVFSDKT